MMKIRVARGQDDMDVVRALFTEYQEFLGFDLCFQGFAEELRTLPGFYEPPAGEIFLAVDGNEIAGVVAVRPVGDVEGRRCEMKRLFVREPWRGLGYGKQLAEAVVSHARSAPYQAMVLDTVQTLKTARSMYARMGFIETAPYYENPLPGVVYMEKRL